MLYRYRPADENPAIHEVIARKRGDLMALCRRHGVERLELFDSAARGADFDPLTSDADFLVTFQPSAGHPGIEPLLDLAEALEQLLGRPVDLVEEQAIRNPYFQADIDRSREVVYAS